MHWSPRRMLAALLLRLCADGNASKHKMCNHVLPSCISRNMGTDAEWSAYLRAVYGDPAPPVEAHHTFNWFWRCRPNTAMNVSCGKLPPSPPLNVTPATLRLSDSPPLGSAYVGKKKHDGLFKVGQYGFFVRTEYRHKMVPSDTWVEVVRGRKSDEGRFNSTWYYAARGSGVWINVGKTTQASIRPRQKFHLEQVALARSHGFDTLQFPNAWHLTLHEIVDLRPAARQDVTGPVVCGNAELRSGWQHHRPCACRASVEISSCETSEMQ